MKSNNQSFLLLGAAAQKKLNMKDGFFAVEVDENINEVFVPILPDLYKRPVTETVETETVKLDQWFFDFTAARGIVCGYSRQANILVFKKDNW